VCRLVVLGVPTLIEKKMRFPNLNRARPALYQPTFGGLRPKGFDTIA
jgi:hypothetical protein